MRFFAEFSAARNWSIIPLRGDSDPSNPKAPALPSWKIYQQKPPSRRLLKLWFDGHPDRVAGIVTGRVSHLAVLDIDKPERAVDFIRQCPDLTQTLTVRSGNRQLPHYYFYVPDELTVPSRHADGVDLRSDGQYVVSFGSTINGQCWELLNDLPPRPLNKDDLARLLAFIASSSVSQKPNAANPPLPSIQPPSRIPDTTDEALVKRYRQLAYQVGRNNALFTTACYARDHDWAEADVCRALIQSHVAQPPPPKHVPETPMQRQAEALATINSVFNRPARPDRPMGFVSQLPNAVREKLLQLKLDNVARVLDGLLMVGYRAGQTFTASQAYQALGQLGIGRNTVYTALKAVVAAGRSLIGQAAPPSPPHPLFPDANAAMRCADVTKLMRFGRDAKPGKIAGRPEHHHLMPSTEMLCEALDVKA
ncbi:MAG: bifunctional DNA primase/polymerase, partial [Chitinophagaceae bacterium]|nr:bifunctional DNA primase/polymerase [Anaerolineae bacterium]